MAFINYIEPMNLGQIFVGMGTLIITFVFCYIILKVAKPFIAWIQGIYNHDLKYWIVEEKILDEVAKSKGIDLDAELIKREAISKPTKSFRKKIEDEVFDKMFPQEKKKSI